MHLVFAKFIDDVLQVSARCEGPRHLPPRPVMPLPDNFALPVWRFELVLDIGRCVFWIRQLLRAVERDLPHGKDLVRKGGIRFRIWDFIVRASRCVPRP